MATCTFGADPRPRNLRIPATLAAKIGHAVLQLDGWLDSVRLPGGYGGPVVHWWRDCLEYTGPGLDWRYEGILIGYLNLWDATGETRWLAKAKRAGDDLCAGQLPSGHYRNSGFEQNPNPGGTPHEAACDLALLRLALALRAAQAPDWAPYAQAAERNLTTFYVAQLWDKTSQSFQDAPGVTSFVPNKAATMCEALFALAQVTGDEHWVTQYALPTLNAVLAHQVKGGVLDGAIAQNSFGSRRVNKFFPYYIARCIPALLAGYAYTHEVRFAEAARRAAEFVVRTQYPDGSFPQVVYPGGRVNRYPQWVAAVGDVLRALALVPTLAVEWDHLPTLHWLLAGRHEDGSVRTAVGFGHATPGGSAHDPRDTTPVCGWADKAFRYFARLVPSQNA